jgi:hypothetical protein
MWYFDFYGEELSALRSTAKLEGRSFSAVCDHKKKQFKVRKCLLPFFQNLVLPSAI